VTGRRPGEAPAYELIVAGALGPVLCSALRPFATACLEVHTVVRAARPGDLVDVVHSLQDRGLDIAAITVVA
jgi:hypothetical protein